jgi:hypothetical protein
MYLSKSSPRSPDLEYMKMQAGVYNTQIESPSPGFLGSDLRPLNINVQTDISISPDNNSTTTLTH